MDASAAYMVRMGKRLYAVDLAVAADDGNDGIGGGGGKANAIGGNGIARVNGQAMAAAAVEEEAEEGAVDRDDNCTANGNGGPVMHGDHKDGNGSAAPCTRRMTMTTAATATGGDWDQST